MTSVKPELKITDENLSKLFLENKHKFYNYLDSKGCRNLQDKEEIINDALLSVWADRHKFKGDCSLNSWVIGNISLKRINYITNKKRYQRSIKENTDMSEAYEPKYGVNEALANRLSKLRLRSKQIMELVLQDYSNHEIAEELNISYDTAKVTYLNGIKYLRKFKKEYQEII